MSVLRRFNFKINNKIIPAIYLIISWAVVGFGQPAWSRFLGVLTGFLGFALFWKGLFYFSNKKERFWVSVLWFMAIEGVHLSWMTASEYQGSYIYIVYVCMLTLLGLQFGFLNIFMKPSEELTSLRIGFIAGLWVWMEWLKLFFICGFPFNPVGLALSSTLWGMQGASLLGVYGLSFWVILTNLIGYKCFSGFKRKWWVIYITAVALPYLFGFLHIYYHQKKIKESGVVQALLVQTALNPTQKIGFKSYEKMLPPIDQWGLIYEYLSEYKNSGAKLIILPERTVPLSHNTLYYPKSGAMSLVKFYLGNEGVQAMPKIKEEQSFVDNLFFSQTLANFFKAQVIVGLEHVQSVSQNHFLGNASAFHFSPNMPYQMYHKRVLLPLVEYLPYEWCKKLARRYNIYGWYEPGKDAVVFQGEYRVSPSICMEEMFTFIVRKNRVKGAELFVNITNDVWYPNSKLPKQHYDHGILRAVENGVPLLRSCNTGVTAAVDATGKLIKSLKEKDRSFEWKRGALYVEISKYQYKTLYSLFGDGLILFISTLFVFYFYFMRYKTYFFSFSKISLLQKLKHKN